MTFQKAVKRTIRRGLSIVSRDTWAEHECVNFTQVPLVIINVGFPPPFSQHNRNLTLDDLLAKDWH